MKIYEDIFKLTPTWLEIHRTSSTNFPQLYRFKVSKKHQCKHSQADILRAIPGKQKQDGASKNIPIMHCFIHVLQPQGHCFNVQLRPPVHTQELASVPLVHLALTPRHSDVFLRGIFHRLISLTPLPSSLALYLSLSSLITLFPSLTIFFHPFCVFLQQKEACVHSEG